MYIISLNWFLQYGFRSVFLKTNNSKALLFENRELHSTYTKESQQRGKPNSNCFMKYSLNSVNTFMILMKIPYSYCKCN